MLVGEHAFFMLLSREKFMEFSKLPIADPTTHTLALYCGVVRLRAARLDRGGRGLTHHVGVSDTGFEPAAGAPVAVGSSSRSSSR